MKIAHLLSCTLLTISSLTFTKDASHHLKHLAAEYCLLANQMLTVGKKIKARDLYLKAVELDESNQPANAHLGRLSYERGDIEDAIKYLSHAVKDRSDDVQSHFNLSQCYIKQQNWSSAFNHLQQVVSQDTTHEKAYLNLGSVCEKLHKYDEAINAYRRAIEIKPESFEAHHQLGNVFRHLERLEEAVEPYQCAMSLQPQNVHVTMDLANVLNMLHHNEESLELYKKIVEKNPNIISALYNFGFTLKKMGRLKEAMEVYHRVLEKKPDYAPVHFSLASIYLALGNLEQGWQEYDWRWKAYSEKPEKFNRPLWEGQDLTGRTLLVYAEQGLGDTLQFIRYVKLLKEHNPRARIIFESQAPLTTLLKMQPYFDHVFSRNEQAASCDYHIPLMSMPRILKTRMDTIPGDTPYIEPSAQLVTKWKDKLSSDRNFKIGLCWQGNAGYSTQSLRRAVAMKSIHLREFAPLFELPNVSIYSLQLVHGVDQINECSFKDKLITFGPDFDKSAGRFMDTAAVMKNLDLVISVDTGTCHLAAAMNVPTWIILPFPSDWRWFLNRSDSPWYPSVQLFRQVKTLEWKPVIQAITQALKATLNQTPHTTLSVKKEKKHYDRPTQEQQLFFDQIINSLE